MFTAHAKAKLVQAIVNTEVPGLSTDNKDNIYLDVDAFALDIGERTLKYFFRGKLIAEQQLPVSYIGPNDTITITSLKGFIPMSLEVS